MLKRWGLFCLLAGLAPAVCGFAPSGEKRLGWHGEPMPQGLIRGSAEGEYIWKKDQSVMVYIPPGPFPMGSMEGPDNERPVHEVYLDGYYIDKYEVSWRQWKLSGLSYAKYQFSRMVYPEAQDWGILDDHPVMAVSWIWAQKYAQWAGKQLPSEAQWEKAARGTDGRRYPWGNDPVTIQHAFWKDHPTAKVKAAPVNCCPKGASPYGVYNMAGNAYEWCLDYYSADYYAKSPRKNPVNLEKSKYRILRGGAFVLDKEDLRSALRYRLREDDRAPYIGFRLALPAPQERKTANGEGQY